MFYQTPRVGHPAKEGLRPIVFVIIRYEIVATQSGSSSKRGIKTLCKYLCPKNSLGPRVGHPAKEGLRQSFF